MCILTVKGVCEISVQDTLEPSRAPGAVPLNTCCLVGNRHPFVNEVGITVYAAVRDKNPYSNDPSLPLELAHYL